MDYYIVINEQKQGPFDFLAVIKKIRNGAMDAATLVSVDNGANFVPAGQVPEIEKALKSSGTMVDPGAGGKDVKINLKTVFMEGVDLWTRRIINYTIFLALIFLVGFGFSAGLKTVQIIADYSFVADYLTGVICYILLGAFYYYVLQTKRSQEMDLKDFQSVIMSSLAPLLLFAIIASFLNVIYTSSGAGFIIGTAATTVFFTIMAFIPLLITDHKISFSRALSTNFREYKQMNSSCLLAVFVLIAMNTIPMLVLGMISTNFMIIGLIITLPITLAALSYIYDQVFA